MTDDSIEAKALALVREVLAERDLSDKRAVRREVSPYTEALCRAIEQHEAFKQEVSDAITVLLDRFLGDGLSQGVINGHLHSFIIRKPDPLVEVIKAMRDEPTPYVNSEVYANRIHKKLDALGFEIREKGR
jgi:hypothetical protein